MSRAAWAYSTSGRDTWRKAPCILQRVYGAFRLAALGLLRKGKAVKAILIAIGLLLLSWVLLAICEALPALPVYHALFMGGR